MQSDSKNGMKELMRNPAMAAKVEKLIAAGVLKVGWNIFKYKCSLYNNQSP